MGYSQKYRPTVNIDLSDMGDNNGVPFFIEIKNPKFLTFEEKTANSDISKITDEKEKKKAMKNLAQSYIVNWNLLDKESEQPVSYSVADAFDHVPSEALEIIMKTIGKSFNEGNEEIKNS